MAATSTSEAQRVSAEFRRGDRSAVAGTVGDAQRNRLQAVERSGGVRAGVPAGRVFGDRAAEQAKPSRAVSRERPAMRTGPQGAQATAAAGRPTGAGTPTRRHGTKR